MLSLLDRFFPFFAMSNPSSIYGYVRMKISDDIFHVYIKTRIPGTDISLIFRGIEIKY